MIGASAPIYPTQRISRPSKKGSVATPVLLLKDEFFVVTGVTTLRGMRFLDSLIRSYLGSKVVQRERFEELVAETLEGLPLEFQEKLENIVLVVEDWPSQELLASVGLRHRSQLLGLYEGVPLTEGGRHRAALPDKITIFQKPIERICRSDKEIKRQIGETVRHEIAHYFGISDERLREIEEQGRR